MQLSDEAFRRWFLILTELHGTRVAMSHGVHMLRLPVSVSPPSA